MKEDIYKELEDLSPLLADIKKAHPDDSFKTPKFYFDTLTDKILAEAKAQEAAEKAAKAPPQYPSLSERLNYWLSSLWQPKLALAMGSFAVIATAGWFVFMQPRTPVAHEGQLSVEDIQTYIHQNIEDFDEETLIENTLSRTATTEGGQKHPQSGLSEDELEQYLDNNLEEEDLENL